MLSNGISKAHHAHILSCFGLGANVWLTFWPIFLNFRLASLIFSLTLWIWLGLPSLNCRFPLMCVHTFHRPYYGYLPFTLCSKQQAHRNPWCSLRHLYWFPCGTKTTTCVFFKHVQFLMSASWHCAHQKWHSHLSQRCYCKHERTYLLDFCTTQKFIIFNVAQAK